MSARLDIGRVGWQGSRVMESLYEAAKSGDGPAVRRLLAGGARVDFVETAPPRWTPMMVAALEGHVEVVEVLVEAGASQQIPALTAGAALAIHTTTSAMNAPIPDAVWGGNEPASRADFPR